MSKKERIVALFCPKNDLIVSNYLQCHEKIDEIITDPNVHVIIAETFTFAIKYLGKRRYRKCTVYHLGETPRKKHSFKNKGGFTSTIELEECLRQDATEEIFFECN